MDSTPLCSEAKNALAELCKEYKDIFSLHQDDIGHTKLLMIDIDTGDHPRIVQKPYTFSIKKPSRSKMRKTLEKAEIISQCVFS